MKLSQRLQALAAMINPNAYQHIWDCCCDHGYLGSHLLQQSRSQVHFVDIVPQLIEVLQAKLQRHFHQDPPRWTCHCLSLDALRLPVTNEPQLLIIAGIGGQLMGQLLSKCLIDNTQQDLDILLCPTNHAYHLRQQLVKLDLGLICEQLITDKQRYYEAILLSHKRRSNPEVSAVGEQLWSSNKEAARTYLKQILNHYLRVQAGQGHEVQAIIDAYRKVSLNNI